MHSFRAAWPGGNSERAFRVRCGRAGAQVMRSLLAAETFARGEAGGDESPNDESVTMVESKSVVVVLGMLENKFVSCLDPAFKFQRLLFPPIRNIPGTF
jgi:hypothetical protein